MKRSELKPGMEVEIKTGRDYARYERAIVLSTDPWDDGKYTKWSKFSPRKANGGSGVAVAIEHVLFVNADHHTKGWRPGVVQLQQLVPAGTEAADRQVRQEQYERNIEAKARRTAKLDEIRERLDVRSFELSWARNGSDWAIELPTTKLVELLDRIDELEAQVANKHTTPADASHTIDS